MINVYVIMQNQCVITLAPIVADPRFAIDDQRIDTQLYKGCGHRKPGLSSTDNQHGGITVSVAA